MWLCVYGGHISNMGSYGAYSIHKLSCSYHGITFYRTNYKTLKSIQIIFDEMNNRYESFKKQQEEHDTKPNVIY